jgi:hypothetical protein
MNIVQTALSLTRPDMMNGIYIIYCNNFVTILGVVFATVWTTKHNWSLQINLTAQPNSSIPPVSSIQFQPKALECGAMAFDKHDEVEFNPA